MSKQRLSIGGVKRMARPIVKYLDPVSGEYEFATVVDIGDLEDLNTTIKSDIVSAINSIISGGVHNPISDERLEDLERILESIKDGTFNIEDFGSIDEYLKQQFLEELDRLNAQNKEEMEGILTQLDTSVDDAIRDYQERVVAQNIILENAENTLTDARSTLEAKAEELETANIGFSELETEFNELDNYISTNVRTIDFDNFNAMVEDYESVVTQTSDEVGVDMSGSTLSHLTGRVADAEANISVQADEITSKMGYDEFQYMPVPKYDYGENLLFDTFDFGDAWNGKNGAQVTPDTFLFGKVVAFNSPTGLYETRTDDLTIGESYVFSTYVNVQPSDKSPSQGKYEPISESYDPTDFTVQIGGASFNPGVYEDLSGINGWVRINQEFVADAVNPIISITPTGVNSQNEIAYMAMPKLEKDLTVTPWQPHLEDDYATLSSTQSMIKQQANSITAFVTGVEELDESYRQATSTFQMLADGFKANTEAVEAYEDTVSRYGTEYSNINGKFEQKVWKDDFEGIIEDINIDNRNRVLNSDFIRNEISSTDRRLIVEDWSLNSDWGIKTIDDNKYLSRNRTGLVQNLITSASSNYFPVRDKERVLFGFDLIHSGLDNDKVFAIELFDISDKRLLKEEFSLSSLTKVGNRYHGSFNISTPGTQKGRVVLQLPRNGSVSFTKISFQNADIGSIDWSPAPEDSWIIQSKLESYISQVEDEITIGAVGQKMNTLTGLLTEDKGTFTLNPDKIATEVFNSETYDDMGFVNKTNFEQTADGWIQEITDKGRLAGYINASPDTYRISFDKIMLEGTTWADRLGSSKIMVTENFALMGRNGTPVLSVNNDGTVEMNVSKMNIGASQVATQKDIEDIELTPGPRGKDAVTVSLETLTSAYEYTADGKLGPVKSTSIQAWHNDVLSGAVYYEFIVNGSTKQNTTNGEYMYNAPDNYSDMPQTVEVKIREGNNSGSVLATDFITIVGIKPGLDGGDAYTVMLDNESHTFGGDANNAFASSLDIEVISYKGTDRIIASVGAISGLPSGMKVGVVNNNTVSPKISFTVTTSMTSPNGTITIPITVDGKVFNKIFTYSISFKGDSGKDGNPGKDGVGIQKTEIHYAKSTSGTNRPSTGWNLQVPSTSPGDYIWTRTTWTYTDGDVEEGYSVSRIGKDGNTGKDGVAGKDGVGIKSTVIDYATSSSGTTKPTSGWSSTVPSVSPGNYLWTRTVWTYTDNDVETGYSVSRIGKDGEKGPQGPQGIRGPAGSNGQSQYVHIRYSANSNGSGMTTSPSSTTKYVGIAVTNSATAPAYTGFTWSKYVGENGSQGPQGLPGKDGDDGTTTYTWVRYADTPTSGMNQYPDGKKYIGLAFNKTTQTESSNYSDYEWSLMPQNIEIGGRNLVEGSSDEWEPYHVAIWQNVYTSRMPYKDKGLEKGAYVTLRVYLKVPKGEKYGVCSRINVYRDDNSYTNVSGNYIEPGNEGYSEVTWKLPNSDEYTSITAGFDRRGAGNNDRVDFEFKEMKLEKGNTATDWTPAPEDVQSQINKSVKSTDVEYYLSTSSTGLAGGKWQTTAPDWINGRYMWSRTKVVLNDGTTSYNPSTTGTNITGAKGSTGAAGKGVSSITEEYYLSTSKTSRVGGSWTTTAPTWSTGKYMWTRSKIVWVNPSSTTYTDPIVDNSWEAVNEIEIGGVNIVLEGWKRVSTSNYMVAEYFIDEDFITGQTYTAVFKGTKPSTQQFGLWQNRGSNGRGSFVEVEKDIWKLTFTSISTTIGNERRIQIYQPNSGTAGPATIEWFKIVKGNKTSNDWQENLNDSFSGGDNLFKNSNFYKTHTGNSFTVGGVSYNTYARGWGGYNGGVSNPTTNYHAHIDNTTFNFPVIEYNETNGNRGWKGITASNLQNNTVALLKKDANYNFSADVYATGSGTRLFGGFYYFKVGGTQKSFHSGQFWIGINKANSWHRVSRNLFLPSDVDTSRDVSFYIYGYDFSSNSILYISNVKLAEGNKISAWSQSPEDTQSQIDEKANQTDTEERLNEIASELLVKQQEIEAAATAGELDAFVKKYNQEQEAFAKEKKASEEALASAEDAIDLITNKMDNMAETWEFFDEYIKFEKGSIILGNETEGSHVRIHNDRISFYSNGYEVAAITQGRMTIEAGTFVEEIQISEFKFQKSSNGHLTVRYVG